MSLCLACRSGAAALRPSARTQFRSGGLPLTATRGLARRGPSRTREGLTVEAFGIPGLDENASIGLTKSQELLAGRIAMQGFAWSILCEHLTGSGPLTVIGIETGVPFWEVDAAVLAFVALNTALAVLPARGTFISTVSGSKGEAQQPYGAADFGLGVLRVYFEVVGEKVGLTKERELFIGRCAQLGLSTALVTEAVTGAGILTNLDVDTGISLEEANPFVLVFSMVLILIGLNEGRGKFSE